MNAELGKQETCDQRAGNADQDVTDDAKAGAAHDLARQPAGDEADKQNNENAFVEIFIGKFPRFALRLLTPRF